MTDFSSIQYKEVANTYDWFLALLNRDGWNKAWAIIAHKVPDPIFLQDYLNSLKENLEEYIKEEIENAEEMGDEERPSPIPENLTVEKYYDYCRNGSWDLWSAAIGAKPFTTYTPTGSGNYKHLETMDDGYELSEHYSIGIILACTTYLYGTDSGTFSEFDT